MNIRSFSKSYDGRLVLDFPGIVLHPGEVTAVIGANGCGKSTLAKVIAGVIRPDQRRRVVDVRKIGYMPQKNFAFRMSTKKNILLSNNAPEKADELMQALHLEKLADKPAHKLSGGETARMALARLMMCDYELVLLDEPTAAMDMETTLLSEQLILDYVRNTSCALVLVTHSLQQARRVADQVLFFKDGTLRESGKKEQILSKPNDPELRKFLDFYGV